MSAAYPEQVILFDELSDEFAQASNLAQNISAQNSIYTSLVNSDALTHDLFRETVDEHLRDKQESTFKELAILSQVLPYEEFHRYESELQSELDAIDENAAQVNVEVEHSKSHIEAEKELILKQLPELEPRLQQVAELLEDTALSAARTQVEATRTKIEEKLSKLRGIIDIAGMDWPIPQIISTREVLLNMKESGEFVLVDDFPEEPTERTIDEIVEDVRRSYPEEILADASEFIALLMAEEPGHIYTIDEIGCILYGKEEPNRTHRVSALISNFERQEVGIIGRVLQDSGLVFQRGVRRAYYRNGTKFGPSKAIFRAVPQKFANRRDRIVHKLDDVDWVHDSWHAVFYDFSETNSADEPIMTHVQLTESKEDSVISITAKTNRTGIDQENILVEQALPEASNEITLPTEQQKRMRDKAGEWRAELRTLVEDVISRFEADGLMEKGNVTRRIVATKSSSMTTGTETMIKRAQSRQIVTHGELDPDIPLPLFKFIAMAVQQNNNFFFESRRLRRQALHLIERIVEDYFKEEEQ